MCSMKYLFIPLKRKFKQKKYMKILDKTYMHDCKSILQYSLSLRQIFKDITQLNYIQFSIKHICKGNTLAKSTSPSSIIPSHTIWLKLPVLPLALYLLCHCFRFITKLILFSNIVDKMSTQQGRKVYEHNINIKDSVGGKWEVRDEKLPYFP